MRPVPFEIDHDRVERLKTQRRRVWAYQRVDHIPVVIELYPSCGYTNRQRHEDLEAWFDCNVESIRRSLASIPDDYIPCTHLVWGGFMTIATMFGASIHWSSDPDQDPGVQGRIITAPDQVYSLAQPDPHRDGEMPKNLHWMHTFAERFPPDVYLAGLDLEGPLANVFGLMDEQLFYISLKRHTKEMHHLVDLVTRTMIACQQALVEAAGGIDRMTCVDYSSLWHPEGIKGYTSDDICSYISPDNFREFSLPYNSRIYQRWPGGSLHNCGPHPSAHLYLHHNPPIHGLNCSYKFTRKDMPVLKEEFGRRAQEELGHRGHLEVLLEWEKTGEEMVAAFRDLMELLAPDVFALPICMLDADAWSDADIKQLYWDMRRVADEFARNMRWAGD